MIKYRRDLWKLCEEVPGNAVEVGVAEGNFSLEILNWPVKFKRLFLVDRWRCTPQQKGDGSNPQEWHDKNLSQVHQKIIGHEDRVVILRGSSVEMAERVSNRSLALVYIDADHSYRGVMADIVAWTPKLVPGGHMAFHDYDNPAYGVGVAVREFCGTHRKIHHIPEDKPEDAGAYFRWGG